MDIEFDPSKEETNLAKHGISLSRAVDFEMLAVKRDARFEYEEERYRAWGLIGPDPFCLVFTARGSMVRVISLRRAHEKEMTRNVT